MYLARPNAAGIHATQHSSLKATVADHLFIYRSGRCQRNISNLPLGISMQWINDTRPFRSASTRKHIKLLADMMMKTEIKGNNAPTVGRLGGTSQWHWHNADHGRGHIHGERRRTQSSSIDSVIDSDTTQATMEIPSIQSTFFFLCFFFLLFYYSAPCLFAYCAHFCCGINKRDLWCFQPTINNR